MLLEYPDINLSLDQFMRAALASDQFTSDVRPIVVMWLNAVNPLPCEYLHQTSFDKNETYRAVSSSETTAILAQKSMCAQIQWAARPRHILFSYAYAWSNLHVRTIQLHLLFNEVAL